MSEVTELLKAAGHGDAQAANQLLPLVYNSLRQLAGRLLSQEAPGQTLQPTALVHEAYLQLVGPSDARRYVDQGHFFATAAQAMRHILVDNARRKQRHKHGGGRTRVAIDEATPAPPSAAEDLLALDEALTRLGALDAEAAAVVQLQYFGHWTFARAWLLEELSGTASSAIDPSVARQSDPETPVNL